VFALLIVFLSVIAGDDTEASSGLGRGAVQHAAKSQPAGVTDGRSLAGRCDGRDARCSRRRRRRRLRVQQLRRAAHWRRARRRRFQRTVGRRLVTSLPGFHVLNFLPTGSGLHCVHGQCCRIK